MIQLDIFSEVSTERPAFREFNQKCPEVYQAFEKITFEKMRQGFANYGAKAICEELRWHTNTNTGGKYKIPNVFSPDLARKFMTKYPQHQGYFRVAEIKQDINEHDNY